MLTIKWYKKENLLTTREFNITTVEEAKNFIYNHKFDYTKAYLAEKLEFDYVTFELTTKNNCYYDFWDKYDIDDPLKL